MHRGRLSWSAAASCATLVVASAALLGALAAFSWQWLIFGLALIAALVMLTWRPAVTLVVAVITCQELQPQSGGDQGSQLLVFGHEFYYSTVGPVAVPLLIAAVAAGASLWHWQRRRQGHHFAGWGTGLILLGSMLVASATFLQGFAPTSIVNQYMRPYLLAALCLAVGATAHTQPGGRRGVMRAAGGALLIVGLTGFYLFVSASGWTILGESDLVFYDSAMPAIAGAVLLALAFSTQSRRWRVPPVVLAGCAAAILVLSFRRNVWIAAAVVFLLALLLRRGRARLLAWTGAVLAVGWAVIWLATPELFGVIGDRAVSWLSGGAQDVSVRGHTQDIFLGLQYALHPPSWLGWGPTHPPLPGLFNQAGYIYIHDEYLYDWARYGVLGLIAIAIPVVAGMAASCRWLRCGGGDVLDGTGAVLLLLAPICAITAPFLSSTNRWPLALGLAAGFLLARYRGDPIERGIEEGESENPAQGLAASARVEPLVSPAQH